MAKAEHGGQLSAPSPGEQSEQGQWWADVDSKEASGDGVEIVRPGCSPGERGPGRQGSCSSREGADFRLGISAPPPSTKQQRFGHAWGLRKERSDTAEELTFT